VRIHYDHQVFSLQSTGGNTRYHFELMRHLAGHPDLEQEVFLGLTPTAMPFFDLAARSVRVVGRQTALRAGGRLYMLNEALNSAFALTRGRFDIYHPTHHRFNPLIRARRMVVTNHDCTQEKFPEEFRYNERVLRFRRALFARADAIICISEASRKDLLHFYEVDPAKTRVIHHGLTGLVRSRSTHEEFARLLCGDFLLYVGARAHYKNFHGLLHAFRDSGLNHSMDLLVLGGGPMSPEHQRLIADLGISDSVTHVAMVSDAQLAEAYATARLLAYPSWSEGFGFPPLEAMSFGCPVLVCNASSLPEICGDAPFYYEKDEPESLRDTLLRSV
jgi:glycosyltransferase involved in cell wall biosynthesis